MWILIGYQYAHINFFKSIFFGHLLIKYIELLSFELKIESCNPCIYSFYNLWGDRFIKKNWTSKFTVEELHYLKCHLLSAIGTIA